MRIQQIAFDKWSFNEEIDLIIADPPFSLDFTGKASNYNRNADIVVDGYVEWTREEYPLQIQNLLDSCFRYLKSTGSLLIFSGWQMSSLIGELCEKSPLYLQGKLYWQFNFIPPCKKRPNHNIYEIFWLTKNKNSWKYNNRCSYDHCLSLEKNLACINIKKEYLKNITKYPTRFPSKLVGILIEHFTTENDVILDVMCGSGIIGVIVQVFYPNRTIYLGDLNPNSQIVYNALLKYFSHQKNANKSRNLSDFLNMNKSDEN